MSGKRQHECLYCQITKPCRDKRFFYLICVETEVLANLCHMETMALYCKRSLACQLSMRSRYQARTVDQRTITCQTKQKRVESNLRKLWMIKLKEIFTPTKSRDFESSWKIHISRNSKFSAIRHLYLAIVKDNPETRKGSWLDKGRDKSYFMVCFVKSRI